LKKPGKWIATFGPSLRVSRVNVEASPTLDLVQITTVGQGEQLTNVFYFDRVEGAALVKELHGALDELEKAAVELEEASEAATDHPPLSPPGP
jgi:hypothetical protein